MQNVLSFNEKLGFRKQSPGFATKAIHAGQSAEQWNSRAVVAPITTSTTYSYDSIVPEENPGYQYGRYKNPSRDVLEACLASIDGAEFALTFSAGVGSLTAILTSLETGDEIITTHQLYGGSNRLFRDLSSKMGVSTDFVDFTDLKSFEKALKPKTRMVWIESPTNPLMTILDIKAIADIVHSKSNAFLVVDNTFLTPYLQRPLELGADVSMISLSKFTNGHSDVIMGALTTNNQQLYEKFKYYQISTGVVPSPFDCYLVNRSLKTLALRMDHHSENSYAVAQFLENHPKVEKVFHPALKSHANHEVALAQSYGHSGVMSFYLKGSLEDSKKFCKALKLIVVCESLGGAETNVSFPWLMSHADVPEKVKIECGITDNLIRVSIGREDIGELIGDFSQALEKV